MCMYVHTHIYPKTMSGTCASQFVITIKIQKGLTHFMHSPFTIRSLSGLPTCFQCVVLFPDASLMSYLIDANLDTPCSRFSILSYIHTHTHTHIHLHKHTLIYAHSLITIFTKSLSCTHTPNLTQGWHVDFHLDQVTKLWMKDN